MRLRLGWIGLAVILAAAPSVASARGPRGGVVNSPFGAMYNTNSPEWKQSGGNPMVYEQIMAQKAMMQQQQAMIKQQQMYMQMQKKMGTQSSSKMGSNSNSGSNAATPLQPLTRKKKKPRTYDPSKPVSAAAKQPAPTTPATGSTP
jgi:hypothetical protein